MHRRSVAMMCAVAVVAFTVVDVRGQGTSTRKKTATANTTAANTKPMRTPWGDPDLQGLWNNSTPTPLERPSALATREVLSDEEIEAAAVQREKDFVVVEPTGAYDYAWYDEGKLLKRTSLIVDPSDGRLPPLTPAAQKARAARAQSGPRGSRRADSWEDLGLATRCLTRGAPKRPGGYNNNVLILQTPGQVAILQEMIHEMRIIPLDGRPHLHHNIRHWLGDSRGHWEGDTLVVETTNYKVVRDSPNCCPDTGENLRVVERFRRVDADNIEFTYTVHDPATYTRPWTASIPMVKLEGPMYEYACHEGNYGLAGILRGARAADAKSQSSAPK